MKRVEIEGLDLTGSKTYTKNDIPTDISELTTTGISSGTIEEVLGINSNGDIVRGTVADAKKLTHQINIYKADEINIFFDINSSNDQQFDLTDILERLNTIKSATGVIKVNNDWKNVVGVNNIGDELYIYYFDTTNLYGISNIGTNNNVSVIDTIS